uniref:Leucine carboxyl methyltransferase 1 n=2 Tax=Panagrolaimus sp. JU765 TaxID=591449 RepID=A0AC34RC35_9BILA
MESEAALGDDHLGAQVGMRRRSESVSDDYSVQKTNDDATECKYAAIKLNYWYDNFIDHFAHGVHRRDPEISCGYWARVATVTSFVKQFIEKNKGNCTIISLGAGFDTLFWRLKEMKLHGFSYVEIDFSSVTAKKIRQIRKPHGEPMLPLFFSKNIEECHHSDLHGGDYHLLGADIRQIQELEQKLDTTHLDITLPTLILAECVFVYMVPEKSAEVIKYFADKFPTCGFLNYEQVNVVDKFGQVMVENLKERGIMLPGLPVCENLDSQKDRFFENGFTDVEAWTVLDIYRNYLNKDEVKRIEAIERLDEKELLTQLLEHYSFVYAFKDTTEEHEALSKIRPH